MAEGLTASGEVGDGEGCVGEGSGKGDWDKMGKGFEGRSFDVYTAYLPGINPEWAGP